jgi:hypothetical protein
MDIYANRLIQQLATVVGQWQVKKGKGEKILRYKAKIGRPFVEREEKRKNKEPRAKEHPPRQRVILYDRSL